MVLVKIVVASRAVHLAGGGVDNRLKTAIERLAQRSRTIFTESVYSILCMLWQEFRNCSIIHSLICRYLYEVCGNGKDPEFPL